MQDKKLVEIEWEDGVWLSVASTLRDSHDPCAIWTTISVPKEDMITQGTRKSPNPPKEVSLTRMVSGFHIHQRGQKV